MMSKTYNALSTLENRLHAGRGDSELNLYLIQVSYNSNLVKFDAGYNV